MRCAPSSYRLLCIFPTREWVVNPGTNTSYAYLAGDSQLITEIVTYITLNLFGREPSPLKLFSILQSRINEG